MTEQVYIIEEAQEHPSLAIIRVEWGRDGKMWQQLSRAAHIYWDIDLVTRQQTGPFISLTTPPMVTIEVSKSSSGL